MNWSKRRYSPWLLQQLREISLPGIHIVVTATSQRRRHVLLHSKVLREIPSDQELPNSYRNPASYGTLQPSRRAARTSCMKRILIIEDDRDIVELVRYNLTNEGF